MRKICEPLPNYESGYNYKMTGKKLDKCFLYNRKYSKIKMASHLLSTHIPIVMPVKSWPKDRGKSEH